MLTSSKAFQELAKGERTATALESQLALMEAKIDALLAQAEKDKEQTERIKGEKAGQGEHGSASQS